MSDYSKTFSDFCCLARDVDSGRLREIIIELQKQEILENCNLILEKVFSQKGVFTVLVTLLFYKIHHPEQDIRLHKVELISKDDPSKKGFSGRSFDTKYITPNLKKLKLPSMAESGWLTRSLEQASAYDFDFPGKISGGIKDSFLKLINAVEVNNVSADYVLTYLINRAFVEALKNVVHIDKLNNAEAIGIIQLVDILAEQFHHNYFAYGAAKLPMLAFFAIYQILLKELDKFKGCFMPPVGFSTASDRTSKTSGDLEVFCSDGSLLEAIEIKLERPIDHQMIEIAKEKILKFNPKRYYILSTQKSSQADLRKFDAEINSIKSEHGCQLILNGVLDTLKYYFRLINNIDDFIEIYSNLIEEDNELKKVHKEYWKNIINDLNENNV